MNLQDEAYFKLRDIFVNARMTKLAISIRIMCSKFISTFPVYLTGLLIVNHGRLFLYDVVKQWKWLTQKFGKLLQKKYPAQNEHNFAPIGPFSEI